MGDVGSLAIGGAMGTIAALTKQEFMLLMVGGVFVMEACSVMLQVAVFKMTKRTSGTGRRIFKNGRLCIITSRWWGGKSRRLSFDF